MATRGKRFISLPECPEGQPLLLCTIKWISGGEDLVGRGMRENLSSFKPVGQYFMSSNGFPGITSRAGDWGTWRRLQVVPWESKFCTNPSPDPEAREFEKQRIDHRLDRLAPAFAAKLIEIHERAAGQAPPMPESFVEATRELRLKNDIIGRFLHHSTRLDADHFTEVLVLFGVFNNWKRQMQLARRDVGLDAFKEYLLENVGPMARREQDNGKEMEGWHLEITC
jgi:phage/plasmid-associated DNA primase